MSTQRFQVIRSRVDSQGVALLDMVVQHGGQQVICRTDGMQVTGKMQVDILHGHHLGMASRPQRRP